MACESWKVIRKAIKTHLIELKTEFETLFPMTRFAEKQNVRKNYFPQS